MARRNRGWQHFVAHGDGDSDGDGDCQHRTPAYFFRRLDDRHGHVGRQCHCRGRGHGYRRTAGLTARASAEAAVSRTQFPLLGATVIGILAFAPIGLSEDATGHFLSSLFQVVGISLLLSWILAIILAPLLGSRILKPGPAKSEAEIYQGWGYAPYRRIITLDSGKHGSACFSLLPSPVLAFGGFGLVKQSFFPTNNTPIYFIDFYLPQGTSIDATEQAVAGLERDLEALESVTNITTFVGRGPGRLQQPFNQSNPILL